MSSVLVDSNVLLDLLTQDSRWGRWSRDTLEAITNQNVLIINPIIFAEVSARFKSIEELDEALPVTFIRRDSLPYEAGFLAGKAYVSYKRRGGSRTSPLPDFYIGAHAAVAGYHLLTRDPSRYRTYFPRLTLIAP
ncbi:MAG: type II toxin-antitoxin system VapC family toxin [Actinomycetota bacterium]